MFLQYLNNYIFRFFPGLYVIDLMISIEDVLHQIIQVLYLFFYPSVHRNVSILINVGVGRVT